MPDRHQLPPLREDRGSGQAQTSDPPVVAVDLGATHTRIAVASDGALDCVFVHKTAELARNEAQGVVPGVVLAIRDAIEEGLGRLRPASIGIAVAAYVDHFGVVLQERPFGLRAGSWLRDSVSGTFEVPVVVDNDANMAALGEATLGAARGLGNVAVITLGTTIGLGVIADGRLLRGAHGAACEAGTLLVPVRRGRTGRDPYARAGRLGHGSTSAPAHFAILEELVGGGALLRSIETPAHPVEFTNGSGRARRGIFARAAAGDRRAKAAVRHAIEGWAMLLADLVALFDPEVFVISGGFVEDAPAFIEPLRRRAAELCPLPPDIRIGDLGPQSGLVGAVVAARSVLTPLAPAAALGGSSSRNQGRASGYSLREVEP